MPSVLLLAPLAAAVPLVTFDGAKGTTFTFHETDDPVMGGESHGTFTVAGGVGVFQGTCVDVPSLKAPGFLKATTASPSWKRGDFADASGTTHLLIECRTLVPYKGYKVSLGHNFFPLVKDFKADFQPTADWSTVAVPFSSFSDAWSSYTGEPTKTCATDKSVCVTDSTLKNIGQITFWAEGVAGKVHLEVRSISAGSAADAAAPAAPSAAAAAPEFKSNCKGPVQTGLRYGVSNYPPEVPVDVNLTGEDLATAICCDARTRPYAEPQHFFARPEVDLFGHLATPTTTFYDSVCGTPLFQAPMNRTLAAWKAETTEHGWPSFRKAELVGQVVTKPDGAGGMMVYSACGTYLGSLLEDEQGERYCLDLVCLSGHPNAAPVLV